MRVYLVQHGQAKSKEEDPDRHLTDKGIADVRKVAAFLNRIGLKVSAVWHSGKVRAEQTAAILAGAVLPEGKATQREGLAPNDPVGPVAVELNAAEDDVILVGHLPFVGRLASRLIAGDESAQAVAFRQGGVVCIERGEGGSSTLCWMIVPDLLP